MMNRSPFTSLVLPAILSATTVFTVLTLAFAPRIIGAASIRSLRTENTEERLQLTGENRTTAIHYVGIAIILGVGTGVTTFELIRKWHSFHDSALMKAEELGLLQNLQEPQHSPIGVLPEDQPAIEIEDR